MSLLLKKEKSGNEGRAVRSKSKQSLDVFALQKKADGSLTVMLPASCRSGECGTAE